MFSSQIKQWGGSTSLCQILKAKQFPEDLFNPAIHHPVLESDIHEHARWAFNHIYRIQYVDGGREFDISRYHHGIHHTSRVAKYVPVFANLYRKHGDQEALTLNDEDIKLLQIAALFHDAARENAGEGKWNHESAILLYYYLTRLLNVDKNKAKLIAEATANKDVNEQYGYFNINESESGEVSWGFSKPTEGQALPKNIYQKIIHDAVCLDMIRSEKLEIRTREGFEAQYLDFYKEIASKKAQSLAFDEMTNLIAEARSLIEIQGDSFERTKPALKMKYESEDAYIHVASSINEKNHKIIHSFGMRLLTLQELNESQLLDVTPYQAADGLTDLNMQRALRDGKLFARGIGNPSGIAKSNKQERNETLTELELRKTMRELDIPTRSSKEDRKQKYGNPVRSVCMLGPGAGVYSDAGFLIVNPDTNAVSRVSAMDADTSHGKKKDLATQYAKEERLTKRIEQDLVNLHRQLKMGGKVHYIYGSRHAEILYDVMRYDAIYYTKDPNSYNSWLFNNFTSALKPLEATHSYSPLLQAIYLQKQYEKQYELVKSEYIKHFGEDGGVKKFIQRFGDSKKLPIYEYSGIHNTIKVVPESELTDEKIIMMWGEMCSTYMKNRLADPKGVDLYDMSLDDIKIFSMFKKKYHVLVKHNGPADVNYPEHLNQAINQEIEKRRMELQRKSIPTPGFGMFSSEFDTSISSSQVHLSPNHNQLHLK